MSSRLSPNGPSFLLLSHQYHHLLTKPVECLPSLQTSGLQGSAIGAGIPVAKMLSDQNRAGWAHTGREGQLRGKASECGVPGLG
jgi:hypothetical protein